MAINTQKLLPPSKISLPSANFSGFSIQKKTTEVSRITELSKKYNQQNLNIVKSSLIDIDSLLKSVLSENKSTEETKRRRKEREEYEERESRLELPKEQKKFRLPAVSIPGMSFLDRIKRFLFFTALGWLFSNFQSQLPKLLGIVKIITPIYGVVENVFKFILSSIVNFVERGYETYDKIRALVKSVGGENAQQDFDALSSKMNEYINYILIGGMALTGAISAFATNVSKFKPQQPTPRPTGGGPRVTTGSGGKPPSTGARVTTSGGKLAQRQIAKNFIRTSVKPALSRLPIVGALIEFGLSWALGDPVGKAAFRGIGSLLVGAVGTAIGGPIGAAIGGLLGGEIGGKVYDQFFGGKKPPAYHKGGRIRAYAKGGSVLGDYGSGRTLEVERTKKPTPRPQSTQPGQDVGGQKEIKKLFPNVNENEKTYNKPNPYYALTGAADDFKSAPYGLGTLMGGAIDVALGQEMSNMTIINASRGLENMFYDNYDREKNTIDVQSIISGVVRSAASSAFENIRSQVNKGKKKEEEKPKPSEDPADTPMGPGQQIKPSPATGSVKDTGIKDYKGRSIKLRGTAADAFIDMVQAAKKDSIDLGPGVSSSYRTEAENARVGGVSNSRHTYGEAFDINWNSQAGKWIRNNASRFGFRYNTYSGTSTHFDWIGGYTPQTQEKSKQQTPVSPSTPGTVTQSPSGGGGGWKPILDIISKAESRANGYNAIAPGDYNPRLSQMTIAEANKAVGVKGGKGAIGRYQLTNPIGQAAAAGLKPSDLFSPANQDKIAIALAQGRGVTLDLVRKDPIKAGNLLAGEWAGLPVLSSVNKKQRGESYYEGYNGNSATIEAIEFESALKKAKDGGIASNISSDGNYVLPKQSPTDTKSIEQYTSYSGSGSGKSQIKVQRVVIEKMIPIPMGGKSKSNFMIAGGVNSPDMSAFQS
jgi:muramidase (phage lysozyme)